MVVVVVMEVVDNMCVSEGELDVVRSVGVWGMAGEEEEEEEG